jgi:hypothetical protein
MLVRRETLPKERVRPNFKIYLSGELGVKEKAGWVGRQLEIDGLIVVAKARTK